MRKKPNLFVMLAMSALAAICAFGQTAPTAKPNPAHNPNNAKAPASQSESAQVPEQVVPQQVPSAETQPPVKSKSGKNSKKVERSHPMQPPAELTDPSDKRRVKYLI